MKWAEFNRFIRERWATTASEQEMTWTVREIARHLEQKPIQNAITEGVDIPISKLEEVVSQLNASMPLPYILGEVDFYGLRMKCDSRALIPRPETEELIKWVLDDQKPGGSVIDIGTGSGCIALALARFGNWRSVVGLDVSKDALDLAKTNQDLLGLDVEWVESSVAEYHEGQWDAIVSNPPYIPKSDAVEMEDGVLNYEPHLALFVENEDPFYFYSAISNYAHNHLVEGGALYVEIHELTGDAIHTLLTQAGWTSVEVKRDMNNKMRMVKATK